MLVIQQFYNTDQIVRHCAGKTHWFDADSKRFFNSRIGQNAYPTADPFITLFVSSERCSWNDHFESKWGVVEIKSNSDLVYEKRNVFVGEKRRYSIRSYDSRTHEIDTVGEFQEYNTSKTANNTAKKLALQWEFSIEDQHEFAILFDIDRDQTIRRNAYWKEREERLSKIVENKEKIVSSGILENFVQEF